MEDRLDSVNILGVRVDKVDMSQTVRCVAGWLRDGGKHYIVTTNVEFIMAAQKDEEFKRILNQAHLSVPDSARLGWGNFQIQTKNWLKKIIYWPAFLYPAILPKPHFPLVGGVYLVEQLCKQAAVNGTAVGFLGGQNGAARLAAECMKAKYSGLKVALADDGPKVDTEGDVAGDYIFPKVDIDILFVGFGQVKQEKWIDKNLSRLPVKVAMGVGGSFDEISGKVAAAPKWVWALGFKWLFRLLLQPWRIKRFGALILFVFRVMFSPQN